MDPAVFCGRESEHELLELAWRTASEEGRPQLVVLLAESGVGKTRLVQEFYARLATRYRSEGGGYWPARLSRNEQNLVVNPSLEACDPAYVMPFLWWGVRLLDPSGRNQLFGGAVAAHVAALTPHLQPMYRARRQKKRLQEAGRTLASTLVGSIPIVGGLTGYGQAAFELFQLGRDAQQERILTPSEAGESSSKSLNERILDDLRRLLQPDGDAAQIPAVLVIDDAHFSPADPGLVELVDGILRAAQANAWPLLLIATHWEREWHEQLEDASASVARRIGERFARLNPSWRPTRLRPLPDDELAPLLRAGLPGLTSEQQRRLLARADGNPRFLDEIVRFAQRRARWFVERDPGNALSEEGLTAILEESTDLHRLVEARLYEAPELVRTVVSLSGLQGVRFLALLSRELLERLAAPGPTAPTEGRAQALDRAATPHAFINLLSEQLGEFSQRVFFEVARAALDDLVDEEDAIDALRSVLRDLDGEGLELASEELEIFHALRADVLGASEEPADRGRALHSLAALVQGALERFDFREAVRVAERIVAGDDAGRWSLAELDLVRSQYVVDALTTMGKLPDALRLARRMRAAAEAAAASGSPEARRDLSIACQKVGDLLRAQGDLDGALEQFAHGLELTRELADELVTPQAFRDLAIAFQKVGEIFQARGHLEAAREVFERSLEIARELAVDPAPAQERRDLGVTLNRLGDLLWMRGDFDGALEHYRPLLDISRRLADELASPEARRDLAVALNRNGDALRALGQPAAALEHYQHSLVLSRTLADELATPEARRDLAVALHSVSDALWTQGDLDGAQQHLRPLLDISEQLAGELGTPEARRDLAVALAQMGNALTAQGDATAALERYRQALDLHRHLARELATPQARRDLAVALQSVGNALWAQGDPTGALEHYRQVLEIMQSLADELDTPAARRELTVTLDKVGNVLEAQGSAAAALEHYRQALDLRQLAAQELDIPQARRDLAISLDNIGTALWAQDDLPGALHRYRQGLDLTSDLADELGTPEARRDLAISLHHVGNALWAQGDPTGALEHHRQGLAIARDLADELATPKARRDLAVALHRVGGVLYARGEPVDALELFEPGHRLYREIADELGTPEACRDLAISFNDLGRSRRELGDHAGATESYRQSVAITRVLAAESGTPEAHHDAAISLLLLAEAQLAQGEEEEARAHYRDGLQYAQRHLDAQPSKEARELVDYFRSRVQP